MLPFTVTGRLVGNLEVNNSPRVYVASYYERPDYADETCYREMMAMFFNPTEAGCRLSLNKPKIIFFPLFTEVSNPLDYCFVRRYAERSDLNANPPALVEQGQVSTAIDRDDIISLWDLLRKGTDTIVVPKEKNAYYVYNLTPAWHASIQDAPSEYGSRSTVTLKADLVTSADGSPYSSSQQCMLWRYSIGNGPRKIFNHLSENPQIRFSLNDLEGARPGDNITIDAGVSDDGKKHLKVLRFYPELPHVYISDQVIEPTENELRTLKVRLTSSLNNDLQEEFTTLTCYKSISMRADGVFNISESKVLFQTDVSKRLRHSGTVEIPIPEGKFLTPGTYYLT
ncbi:MAG: hypothetical protein K2L03_07500, partial [Bacteroidales bacterium]|nr:hypothetical protein [Bacteroidales bacterium]